MIFSKDLTVDIEYLRLRTKRLEIQVVNKLSSEDNELYISWLEKEAVDLKVELIKLKARSWWQRILNKGV